MKFSDSREFSNDIRRLKLNKHELYALRLLLADNPVIGTPDEKYPGIMTVGWWNDCVMIDYYIIDSERIHMISAYQINELKKGTKEDENIVKLILKPFEKQPNSLLTCAQVK